MKLSRLSIAALICSTGLLIVSITLLRVAYFGGNSMERLKTAIITADELQIRFLEEGASSEFIKLDDSQWSHFQQILLKHHLTTEVQTMCHTPMQELRFMRSGSTILQGTLCLKCTNFESAGLSLGAAWVTIMDSDIKNLMELPQIREFLSTLRPEKQSDT